MKRLILILILANFVLYLIIFSALKEDSLVAFLDIGQGSGVLFKDKKNVFLYDTGKYPNLTIKEIDKNLPFYNRKIDILFLSHPDKDHYFSSFEILKRYKVRLIGISPKESQDSNYLQLLDLAKQKKIPVLVFKRGDQIFDNHFKFFVIHPEKNYKKENDNSLVIKVLGKNSYLLTGDIEKKAIESLINCCSSFLKADYFLVPHHGSKYSLNEKFYSLIQPKISIIQVGQNSYGHPHQEILEALKNFGQIWRTDLQKTLIIKE